MPRQTNAVWVDAFLSYPCTVVDDAGAREVHLEPVNGVLHYVATATPQMLMPFCCDLINGDVVTIRWRADEASPVIVVRHAAYRPSGEMRWTPERRVEARRER